MGSQNKIRKEMDRYESFSIPGKNVTTLDWWKQHEGVLPLLSSLAKRILAIPASSSKSERVFSTGGNIVTARVVEEVPRRESDENDDNGVMDIDEKQLIHLDEFISDDDCDDSEDEH